MGQTKVMRNQNKFVFYVKDCLINNNSVFLHFYILLLMYLVFNILFLVICIWSSGNYYVGEFSNGKYNGRGTKFFWNGTQQEGEWRNDKLL